MKTIYDKVKSEVARLGGKVDGDYAMIRCPFHEDKTPSFRVSLKTDGKSYGWGKCYSCGKSANFETWSKSKGLFELVAKSEGYGKYSAEKYPDTYFDKYDGEVITEDWRGISKELLNEFGAKLVNHKIGEAIQFPVWNGYYHNNYYSATHKVKGEKRFRKGKEAGASKLVFAYDFVMKVFGDALVVVCEGERDALTLIQNGVPACAILGSEISEDQQLLLAKFKTIYTAFDNDKAGRKVSKKSKEFGWTGIRFKGKDPSRCKDISKYFAKHKCKRKVTPPKRVDVFDESKQVLESAKYIVPKPSGAKLIWTDAKPGAGKSELVINMIAKRLLEDKTAKFIYCAQIHKLLDSISERLTSIKVPKSSIFHVNSTKRDDELKYFEDDEMDGRGVDMKSTNSEFELAEGKRVVLCTHTALLHTDPTVTKGYYLIIDEALQSSFTLKHRNKYLDMKIGEIRNITSEDGALSTIVHRMSGKESASSFTVMEYPELARFVFHSRRSYFMASALTHIASFQRCYSELKAMRIPVKHKVVKPYKKTGIIRIHKMTNSKNFLSKSFMDNKILRPVGSNFVFGDGRSVQQRDGLVMNMNEPKMYQIAKYFRSKLVYNTLVFLRSPVKRAVTIYHKGYSDDDQHRNPKDDILYIHTCGTLKQDFDKSDSVSSGYVNTNSVELFRNFQSFENKMLDIYKKYYKMPYKTFFKDEMENDNFGIARTTALSGLNSLKSSSKIVFLAPLLMDTKMDSVYKVIYPDFDPSMGILASSMLQAIMRGCARDGKDMDVYLWSEKEVEVFSRILSENDIEYKINGKVLWPNWEIINAKGKLESEVDLTKQCDDGLNSKQRQRCRERYHQLITGNKSAIDMRKTALIMLKQYVVCRDGMLGKLSKEDQDVINSI